MSRSGYVDDCEGWDLIRWRGAVSKATKGKRGQKFLRELLAALDAMPEKDLIAGFLEEPGGGVCALGCLARQRGIELKGIDPQETEVVASLFGIAEALIRELVYVNDEWGHSALVNESTHNRWKRVRMWVAGQVKKDVSEAAK